MKTALLVFLSVASLFLGVVCQSTAKCGMNMYAQNCAPCNRICNQRPQVCPQYCLDTNALCKCKAGYCLPTANSSYCVRRDEYPGTS